MEADHPELPKTQHEAWKLLLILTVFEMSGECAHFNVARISLSRSIVKKISQR
jgi:hypothetical protein